MTSRFPPFGFVELVSPYNKKNITRWLKDMNFMFSWQEQYLTRSLRSLVRYCSCHSNIKFISSRHGVISSIYGTHWPSYLTLDRRHTTRNPRSSAISQLIVPLETETFEDSASRLFNSLPNDMKRETNAKTFARKAFKLFKTKAESRLG